MIEPAIEFSIAIIPKLESPLTTESANSSKDKNSLTSTESPKYSLAT